MMIFYRYIRDHMPCDKKSMAIMSYEDIKDQSVG